MTEPVNDDERLAALLDGRLDEDERNKLLAELAAPGDDMEVFAKTAALLRALEEEDAALAGNASLQAPGGLNGTESVPPEVPPPELERPLARPKPPGSGGWRRRPAVTRGSGDPDDGDEPGSEEKPAHGIPPRVRTRWWGRSAGTLAAAAIVLALAIPGGVMISARGSAGLAPLALADALEQSDRGLPADWISGGGIKRSGNGGDDGSAVRAGAWMTELAVAVQSRDSAETSRIAGELRLMEIEKLAGADPERLRPLLVDATRRLEREDRAQFRLGAWGEAARLAVATRDAAFFRQKATRSPPRAADRLAKDDVDFRSALNTVRALTSAGSPDWAALEAALDEFMIEAMD